MRLNTSYRTSSGEEVSLDVLRIHLLGEFRLVHGDRPLTTINTARLQSLLAYLVLHRDAPQPHYHLAFQLWPDSNETQARGNLRKLLFDLRHTLPDGEQFLHADGQTVQWRPEAPFSLDTVDFETALAQADRAERAGNAAAQRAALEKALSLHSGDLLPSCYEDWIIAGRERLSQAFVTALAQLILLLEGQQDFLAAITSAQRLLR
jgi:DNA-binding SARP family transcriptional activator